MAYEIRVADVDGTNLGTLDEAKIGRVSFELNAPGSASFSLPTTDTDTALVVAGRELQIWKDGAVFWWGPIVRPRLGLRECSWECAGLLWYFTRRFMGRADRVNLLVNGDFEAGEASWSFSGVTHALDTGIKVEGTQSLKLTGAAANHGTYASQTYTHTPQWHPLGDAVTVAAWVYVPTVGYLGGAVNDVGLVAIHRDAVGTTIDAVYVEIGDGTEKDVWIPMEVLVPNVKLNETVEVRVFPPYGVAYYDLVTATLFESLSFWPGADVADIIEGIVLYAQDLGPHFTHGKSDLNIAVSAPATGVTKNVTYMFAEHRNIADALFEYVRQGVVDLDFVYTATTRTLTVYRPKGSHYGTVLELDVNLADFSWSWDGEQAAGTVVMLGPGDGPDRPEGMAVDATFLAGLTLEAVEQAPDEATVGELDTRAAERLNTARRPEILEVTTLPGVGIIGNLETGDTVDVLIQHGQVDIDAVFRVVKIDVDIYTDQAVLTLNPSGA